MCNDYDDDEAIVNRTRQISLGMCVYESSFLKAKSMFV